LIRSKAKQNKSKFLLNKKYFILASKYQYAVPLKTKILNIPRRLFKLKFLEQFLSRKINEKSFFLRKLVPPEYLYPAETWRTVTKKLSVLRLDISNVVDHEIYFNLAETTFDSFLADLGNVEVFWDIGANIGWTVVQVKGRFPNARIFAFEPSSKNRERLNAHVALNKINATVIPYGLGDEVKSFKLYSVLENNPGMNRILKHDESELSFESIEVITGSSFWEQSARPKVNALKIDVEGFEMQVLLGMETMIEACMPQMFIEIDEKNLAANGYTAQEVLKWLFDKGYKLFYAGTKKQIDISGLNLPDHFDVVASQ
jgi:FkbM family methyltransferase